jgi:Fic family protein
MRWNWQQPDWGIFSFQEKLLRPWEDRFLQAAGEWKGSFLPLEAAEQTQLRLEMMSLEALQTARIEGEYLDRESVQASLQRLFGVATEQRRIPPAEQGMAEMMVDVYRNFAQPLDHARLFAWHRMLMQGRRDLGESGRYRVHPEPMQIVSGPTGFERVHFQAPPSAQVPEEMTRFLTWLRKTAPGGTEPLPALTRAGMVHAYFESIHPFEDGNGRIGRALAQKVLSQAVGYPLLLLLSPVIESRRKAYYAALEAINSSNELTEWLLWFAEAACDAQAETLRQLHFLWQKTRCFRRLHGQLNPRQEKVLRRLFAAGPDGFEGGLSAKNYQAIAKASPATTTRDLQDLVQKGALRREGERKGTRYFLAISD